jgi:hypothetical protein
VFEPRLLAAGVGGEAFSSFQRRVLRRLGIRIVYLKAEPLSDGS